MSKLTSCLLGAFLLITLVGGTACMSIPVDEIEADRTEGAALQTSMTEDSFSGTYAHANGLIEFGSVVLEPGVYDLYMEFNGMRITWTGDAESGVIETDGYAADNAASTQMTAEDRDLLIDLQTALDVLDANGE